MIQNNDQLNFLSVGDLHRRLRCPICGERLSSYDVEVYPRCPYCDAHIPNTPELEDFAIDPLVEQWQSRYSNR